MATRKFSDSQPSIPLELRVPLDEAQNKLEVRIKLGQELKARNISSESDLDVVKEEWFSWDDYNRRLLKSLVTTEELAEEYIGAWIGLIGPKSLAQKIKELRDDVGGAVRRLESIKSQLELIPVSSTVQRVRKMDTPQSDIDPKAVFIIHGHDRLNYLLLEKYLRDSLGLQPITMIDQAGQSRALIQKFEETAQKANFAFALLTSDDVVVKNGVEYAQARPNVIFELGWFYGRLGSKKVCILLQEGTSIHSDLDGVSRIQFKTSVDESTEAIRKELLAAGLI